MASPLFLGLDLGTSGCRAMVIDQEKHIQAQARVDYVRGPQRHDQAVEQDPMDWWQALEQLMADLTPQKRSRIKALAIDGTSGSVLLTDLAGRALSTGILYNDNRARAEADLIARHAPANTAARGTASGLAKLLWLQQNTKFNNSALAAHQADWVLWHLGAPVGTSDWNNCLKTGYDPVQQAWPDWVRHLLSPAIQLPQVVAPGSAVGVLDAELARTWQMPAELRLIAGTTDSTAAVMATGIDKPGDAVTSLGSTLVTKILSNNPVFAPEYGVYSQPYGPYWLVGGGSNSGGAVLRQFFSDQEMAELTVQLQPEQATGLDYYPLPATGERFPVCDPDLAPRITPVPENKARFFQALLEGMARIECDAYNKLAQLGCPRPRSVRSVGGGARNKAWEAIRARQLQVPMITPAHTEAAYGAALLALQGFAAT